MYGSRPPVVEVIGGLFCTNMPTNMGGEEALGNVSISRQTVTRQIEFAGSMEFPLKNKADNFVPMELFLLGSIIAIKSATHFSTLENKKV